MDGTFLNTTGNFDCPQLERILDILDQRGIQFVVATGNQMGRMQMIFGDLVDRLSFVAANGPFLVEKGQVIMKRYWSESLLF